MQAQANNPFYAINCLLRGVRLLTNPDLRNFLWLPIIINFVLYGLAFALGYFYLIDLITQLLPNWLSWLQWLVLPLLFVGFTTLGFFTFTLLANAIAAPFYSQLAAKTRLLCGIEGSKPPLPLRQVLASEARRIAYLLSRSLPLLILFVVPLLNIIAPILWGLFAAWALSLEFMAYSLDEQGVGFAQQKQHALNSKWGTLSFGGLVLLGLSIPVLNLLVAPAAVIGATIYGDTINDPKRFGGQE